MIMMMALALAQDADQRYREGLYQEVDRGDLEKAIEFYRKVEIDSSLGESIRARAAYRLAWCLEKQGKKVEAERSYREIASKYSGQDEIAQKAKERLERLVSGNGSGAALSRNQQISSEIIFLGSESDATRRSSMRTLVLLGDAAIPALCQALAHKDPTLSGTAACALVELEQDSGTYSPLERAMREGMGWSEYAGHMTTLIKRQEGYRKDFVEAFKKIEGGFALTAYLHVVQSFETPEFRARWRELLGTVPLADLGEVVRSLPMGGEDLDDFLNRVQKSPEGLARLLLVFRNSEAQAADPRAYARRIRELFPRGPTLDSRFDMLVYSESPISNVYVLDTLSKPASREVILEECAEMWLKEGVEESRDAVVLSCLGIQGCRQALSLMERGLGAEVDGKLLGMLIDQKETWLPHDEVRKEVEKRLWAAWESAGGKQERVTWTLWDRLVEPAHPRFQELLKSVVQLPGFDDDWSAIRESFQEAVDQACNRFLIEGDPKLRGKVLSLYENREHQSIDGRCEALARLGGDESQSKDLRRQALKKLEDSEENPAVRDLLAKLLSHNDYKQIVVQILKGWSSQETHQLLAPLVEDEDLAHAVVSYFANSNRKEFRDLLIRALKSPSSSARREAAKALAATEFLEVAPHLIQLLEDEDPEVRSVARNGLEAIKRHEEELEQWKRWYEGMKK